VPAFAACASKHLPAILAGLFCDAASQSDGNSAAMLISILNKVSPLLTVMSIGLAG
jgi:hypothetical protein